MNGAALDTPTILIVDDNSINLTLVRRVLAAEGFRTLVARDGPTARAIAHDECPDLILLDVMMPGESGFETCARLKSSALCTDVPIIFISALDDVQSKVTGLKIGGVDFVSRPVHAEELLARVRVHLRIRESGRLLIQAHKARLEQLRNAQQSILIRPEELPEASFAVCYRPMEETGGDFYDVVQISPQVYGYMVADISGHGVSAAFLTSALKALLRQYTGPLYSPEDTMRGIDSVMRQILDSEQYLTAGFAHLNRSKHCLSIVSAGHPPLIHCNVAGTAQAIQLDGDPVGMFNSLVLQHREIPVADGDRFYLYSDGLIEAGSGGERRTGLEQLTQACIEFRDLTLQQTVKLITERMKPSDSPLTDDLLLLAVEVAA